jgi:hypothetical protein
MPQLIAAPIAAALGGGVIATAVANIGVGLVFSAVGNHFARQQARRTENPGSPGITTEVLTAGETTPQTLMLGEYMTAGNITAPFYAHGSIEGVENAYRTQIIDLADYPVDALVGIYVDGKRYDIATDFGSAHPDYGLPLGNKWGDEFVGKLWVKFYDGRQTAADAMLVARYGTRSNRPWTADFIGRGVSYAIVTILADGEAWQAEPEVRFVVRGARLYDWRLDSTNGGSGAHRWNNQATWAYTRNPVVMIYNLLRGIPLESQAPYGYQVETAQLPVSVWTAAANVCDQDFSGTPRFIAGYDVRMATPDQGGETPADVIEKLLAACDGEITDIGGTWHIRVANPALPVAHITDGDVIVDFDQTFRPSPGAAESYNAVQVTYVAALSAYQVREAPLRVNTDAVTADGQQLIATINLDTVTRENQAQRLSKAWLDDARRFRLHTITLAPAFAGLNAGETLTWTSDQNGYDTKLFEVEETAVDPRSLCITVTLRERDPDDYDWVPEDELPTTPPDESPTPRVPQGVPGLAVTATTVSDGTNARRPALRLSWNTPLPGVRGIMWQVRLPGASGAPLIEGSTLDVALGGKVLRSGILSGVAYEVRARTVRRGPSTWSSWISVTAPQVRISAIDLGVTDFSGNIATNGDLSAPLDGTWLSNPSTFVRIPRNPGSAFVAVQTAPTPWILRVDQDATTRNADIGYVQAAEGDSFTLRFRWSGSGTQDLTIRAIVLWRDASDTGIGSGIVGITNAAAAGGAWQLVSGQITAPAGTAYGILRLQRVGGGSGTGYVTGIRCDRQVTASVIAPGAVETRFQDVVPGAFPQSATATVRAEVDLTNTGRGQLWRWGVVFDARAPFQGATDPDIIIDIQRRREAVGLSLEAWTTITTREISNTAWAMAAVNADFAGEYSRWEIRVLVSRRVGSSASYNTTDVIRNIIVTLERLTA